MEKVFIPYNPPYSLSEKLLRFGTVLRASAIAISQMAQRKNGFAASVEITDRCNAGCHYCYVYQPEWDQQQRMQGYMQLPKEQHRQKEGQVLETLELLKKKGIVHITVVGGEPALAPKVVQRASELFPIVWVVTNGAAKLPALTHSAVTFVSIDGPPEHHNRSRDPLGYFANNRYGNLTGMSAAIVRNINESKRGAFCHITLTRSNLEHFSTTVDWLVRDVNKLRGIIVSGAATKDKTDPIAFRLSDRQLLKQMIAEQAHKYGWNLFPFNQPKVNDFLFDAKYVIYNASSCDVAKMVESLNFSGRSVGKCVLRDETICETCVCNMTGLTRALKSIDIPTILGVFRASFG